MATGWRISSAVTSVALGDHTLTLRVTDACGRAAEDHMVIRVVDTTAPLVTLDVTPSI